jgi:hypothetical protein
MVGGKCAPEGKSKPSHKCTAIDLELKITMICKYGSGQSLSVIACELGFMVLAANTIMKDAACMNEHERNRIDEVNSKYKERWRCNN